MNNRSLALSVSGVVMSFLVVACSDNGSDSKSAGTRPAVTAATPAQTETSPAEDAAPPAATACPASTQLAYVCGPQNAEDILQIGTSDWLLVSGMNGAFTGTDSTGHIYLVNHVNKTYEELFPGPNPVFNLDGETFATCPGPLNPEGFSAHGLAVKEQSPGQYRLYITSHGEREAIEAFEINMSEEKAAIAWVGCE